MPGRPEDGRSAVETLKARSAGLRGELATELADGTERFSDASAQLLKFHGVYQQDDRDVRRERGARGLDRDYVCMVRASIPGGVLTAAQYLALDGLADALGDATLRATTRQGLQYHFVRKGDLRPLIGALNAHLVTTLAACGDVVRNVMACPAPPSTAAEAQVEADAIALSRALKPTTDAYWQLWVDGDHAVSAHAVPEPDPLYGATYLPRKFKIAFASPGDNCVDVFTQDVGIVPSVQGGRVVAYTLVVGGGLGMTHGNEATYPRLGDPLGSVGPEALQDVVKAIVAIHRDHGDREDRKHARLKYLVAEWGLERLRGEVERRMGRPLGAPAVLAWPRTDDHLGWRRQRDGRWSLGVRIASGRIADHEGGPLVRTALRAVVERFAAGVRLTPRQDVVLTDIDGRQRSAVGAVLGELGVQRLDALRPLVRHALACPALPTCGLALAEAERALPRLLDEVLAVLAGYGLDEESIHVRMTGCPNGCARPYSTEVGIVGRGRDHYTIFLGGDADGTRLNAQYVDRVPVAAIPDVLAPVLEAFRAERSAGERFGDWCARLGVDGLRDRFRPDDAVPGRRAGRAVTVGRARGAAGS